MKSESDIRVEETAHTTKNKEGRSFEELVQYAFGCGYEGSPSDFEKIERFFEREAQKEVMEINGLYFLES